MRLSNIDVRHLRIFLAAVECGGFTAAETVLGISQSTISTHIAELERRVGFRICDRGRSGFALTDRGSELYAAALRLVDAFADFEDRAETLKGVLAGRLRLGLIDNLISDPTCPLAAALAGLAGLGQGPRITIEVLPPSEIEYAIAAGRLDLGVSIAEKRLPSLGYTTLYRETDLLLCGTTHPLFAVADKAVLKREIQAAPKVIRSFLNHHDFFLMSDREDSIAATVTNVEAAAFLILAGTHIGFLPDHYAAQWTTGGAMRALLPGDYSRVSEVTLIEPLDRTPSPAVRRLAALLRRQAAGDASMLSMRESKHGTVSLRLADRCSAGE
ncbi:transcriptional regulator, LysR family [Tistlia consotensis]|uniref:Transcriptional regulator, LysR family n=1 Tax=Tistlia consotensis USBA 355 TaxID=560819 RepID=A0A1Y6C940_9PROT|nr:LysR family transcriptional regulator [Tistlia consotensis]SMF48932.1 transcriptional regulator, LysR family [Tistlia consotensis USBA 355]SNR80618.1 transcriptional regulator, LysR family [Tistlia consotensis]